MGLGKKLKKSVGKITSAATFPFTGAAGVLAGSAYDDKKNGSGPGTPGHASATGDVGTYEEVYNRPSSQQDPNHGEYAWGRDDERTYQDAYNAFRQLFGRNPTQNEFNMAMGAFQGANSAITGRSYLANLQQQYQQNPSLDPSNPRFSGNQNVGDITNQVQQQFQTILGRPATQDELQHFTEAIRSNQTDSYGLNSFLKQQPEYTNAQDKQFRSGLNDELAGYDQKEFGRQKNDIYSDYAARGLGGSSSLDFALTDLMGKLSENRSKYLSGLSAQQYGGNKDLAVGNYKNVLDDMYNQSQQRRQGQSQYGASLIDRGFAGADYGQQMRDYNNAQASQRGYDNTLHTGDYINLGLNAVNAGAKAYSGYAYLNG